tara:strand:- start:98 stop:385 length:288 start_codon:yes stop_codon:yes gene_type:complete
MKTYTENEAGFLVGYGLQIPKAKSNLMYRKVLAEVEASEAEILPYVKPLPTAAELAAPHLAYLAETDWYITRLTETGVVVPDNILKLRSEARESI